MGKEISRKNFIRNLGLFTMGIPGVASVAFDNGRELGNKSPYFKSSYYSKKETYANTRRGSWIRRGNPEKADVTLVKDGSGCQLIVNDREEPAVKQAATFLSQDIEKISRYKPSVVNQFGRGTVKIVMATIGVSAIPASINVDDIRDKWEAYKILTLGDTVWLIGANFRGTAFAVYTLSERLGIDPLYLWTGYYPEQFDTLVLKKTNFTAKSPVFKYRGFFHDDEDILPRPLDKRGYPLVTGDVGLEWYKRYFETELRLRMNITAPYTRAHRRYEVQKCASDWGLIYTSHHYDILLSNPLGLLNFNLAKKRGVKPEWNWFDNRDGMIRYWQGGVEENRALHCIWPVGLRGTGDFGYRFPKDFNETQQAKTFSDVIDIQRDIIRKRLPPGESDICTLTLYTEMLEKYQKEGDAFNIPDDVIIVWPDNNNGIMRSLPGSLGKWKHGIYYHLAYTDMGGGTIQSTHIISPKTVTTQFKNIIDSGATEFLLINVSEFRTYEMEARLISEICWDPEEWLNRDNPSDFYVKWWCNEYFGTDAVESTAAVYEAYYELLYRPDKVWFASEIVKQLLENLVKKLKGDAFEPVDSGAMTSLAERYEKYKAVEKLIKKCSEKMTTSGFRYFFENNLVGLYFDYRPTQAAMILRKALEAAGEARTWDYIVQAGQPLEQLELEILRAERPPFALWYRETWIRARTKPQNVHRPYTMYRAFVSSGGKIAGPPAVGGNGNWKELQIWSDLLDALDK